MELYIKAKCNRKIDREREYATFESFEIMLGDTPICFDNLPPHARDFSRELGGVCG